MRRPLSSAISPKSRLELEKRRERTRASLLEKKQTYPTALLDCSSFGGASVRYRAGADVDRGVYALTHLPGGGPALSQLGDFGASKLMLDPSATMVGTPVYMSPEMLLGEPYHRDADIYALGCTLITLGTGVPPFNVSSMTELKVRAHNTTARWCYWSPPRNSVTGDSLPQPPSTNTHETTRSVLTEESRGGTRPGHSVRPISVLLGSTHSACCPSRSCLGGDEMRGLQLRAIAVVCCSIRTGKPPPPCTALLMAAGRLGAALMVQVHVR